MTRSERLLALIQVLRRHRMPVSGRALAEETGVSLRTLYRDISSLQAQGAPIEGEAGIGYVLRPGFLLPPMMFSVEEIEALVLGSRWVARRADASLSVAADEALSKIAAVLPAALREELDGSTLLVGPPRARQDRIDIGLFRAAIRNEQKVRLSYEDLSGRRSERMIWPFALGFFEEARVVAGWCELRQELRHFRADRMLEAVNTGERYPRRRQVLLKEWRDERARIDDKTADGN